MKGNVKMSYKWTVTTARPDFTYWPSHLLDRLQKGPDNTPDDWYEKVVHNPYWNKETAKERSDKLVKMFGNSSSKSNSFTSKGYGIRSHEEFEEEGNSGVRLVFTLPGADKKDIKVRRDQGDIVVSYDNFTHTTELDFVGEVSPKYKNGLLTVDIFYPEDVKPQDFSVK